MLIRVTIKVSFNHRQPQGVIMTEAPTITDQLVTADLIKQLYGSSKKAKKVVEAYESLIGLVKYSQIDGNEGSRIPLAAIVLDPESGLMTDSQLYKLIVETPYIEGIIELNIGYVFDARWNKRSFKRLVNLAELLNAA